MATTNWSPANRRRREFLEAVSFASAGLTLPAIFQLRAAAAPAQTPPATSVIFIQMGGGPTHLETYDPKPDAPSEYRGPAQTIATKVPGIRVCQWLPEQARIMDKLCLVRSLHHEQASHIALHLIETGYQLQNPKNSLRGEMPSVGAAVAKLRGTQPGGVPAYFSLPKPFAYSNPHYLGGRYDSFNVNADPSVSPFRIENLALDQRLTAARLDDRRQLWRQLDRSTALADDQGHVKAAGDFTEQAFDLLLGERAQQALDLEREDVRLRERYGQNAFGQRLLLARRLVEAEVPFVVVRTFGWDDHDRLETRMRARMPEFDRGVAALVEDLHARGLERQVLVVAIGEFGRTPRVNAKAGRDHWPGAMSALLAGGSYRMGQAIGATDDKGATVAEAPYRPENVLGMVYRHLGIDPASTFPDLSGRPRYLLEQREPIRELS